MNPSTVYQYFDIIWDFLNLNDTPEEFFIQNSDLITISKLRELKHAFINFDLSEKYRFSECVPYKEFSSKFSSKFFIKFPDYLTLQICYECTGSTDVTGKLCVNCSKKNAIDVVMLMLMLMCL